MRNLIRLIGAAVASGLVSGCVMPPSGAGWSSDVLLGTTALGDSYADFLTARYAGMVNDPEASAAYYQQAYEQAPGDADLLDRMVVSLLIAGQADVAGNLAANADPEVLADAPFAIMAAAADDVARGNHRSASRRLERADLGAMGGIGLAVRAWMEAERSAARGVALLEADGGGRMGGGETCIVGLLHAADGDHEAALDAFDLGFDVCSRMPILAAAHIRVAFAAAGAERARAVLERLPSASRNSVEVSVLSRMLDRGDEIEPVSLSAAEGAALGLYVAASAAGANASGQLGAVFFQLMHRIDPNSDLARVELADAHFSLERHDVAVRYADEVDADSLYAARARWEHARALIALEQETDALAELRDLAARDLNRELALRVADAFRLLDAPREAEAMYTRLIELGPADEPDWRPLFGRAAAYNELGLWGQAEADLLAALEINPDQPEVLNFLGYGWVDKGENIEAGLDLIRRAIAQRPQSGYIVDSLGWAHYRLGQYEEAARELERAAGLAPDDAEIIDHLGDAYWRTGRRLEAGFEWRRALALDPEAELAESIRRKLVGGLPEEVAGDMAEATPVRR